MAKKLLDLIAERAKTKQAQNRASFLALKDEIAEAIEAGWSVKMAWETLREHGKISLGYEAFNNYTKRYIKQKEKVSTAPTTLATKKKDVKKTTDIGFNFNAVADPKELF